ncbi:DUF998 domain-containing protein [Cognatilysobacter bugurensis]|uniref:DUF998 domain-containing protein n=1 Tax=Cognatilysobacter bugurensis TaxID=543356 RepID=A0A918SU22_9GAMM|nr:DUF998 domain-containing protein [Lysobacter bugurensis]GHA70322.1 hypothetical protein GCM10007067_03040 [Lysobacter bugurensis]
MEHERLARPLGAFAFAGVVSFAAVALALQGVRTDLDWRDAPLSLYLLGTHGAWLKAAYFALAASLLGLGAAGYAGLSRGARSGAPALLFAWAGIALAVVAVADSRLPGQDVTLETLVHGIAAQAAFLCVTVAMLLQSWRLRLDAAWRHRYAPALALAALAFIALWTHALWRDAPRGLTQKIVVLLVLVWLGAAAFGFSRRRVA